MTSMSCQCVSAPGKFSMDSMGPKKLTAKTFFGVRVYYPACSPGGRLSTSVSASAQSTRLSSLYSAVIAYCLKVWRQQPSNRPVTSSGGLSSVRILAIGTPTSHTPPLQDSRLTIYMLSIFSNAPCVRKWKHCNQIPQQQQRLTTT